MNYTNPILTSLDPEGWQHIPTFEVTRGFRPFVLLFNAKVIDVVPTAKVADDDTAKVPVILEFPVIAAPPLETVKAPVLNVPVMLEFPVLKCLCLMFL